MQFRIDNASDRPVYLQIIDQVKRDIALGRLVRDERLPTVRKLAEQLANQRMDFLGLLGLMRIWRAASKQLAGATMLIALLAFTFLSMMWSVEPDVTFRRAIALFITSLFGLYLATRYDWRSLVLLFAASFAFMAIAGFLGSLLAPKLFVHQVEYAGAWKGVWRHKNLLR